MFDNPFAHLLDELPPIEAYPTVAEMQEFALRVAKDHPDRVVVREIGRSREGDPIQLLTLRHPEPAERVLVIGMPHPNEPIGMATIVTLCERLLAAPEVFAAARAEWHFVPCADPDATRLNEGWFAGPFTRAHYARNFFRPGPEAQVEWTFPFEVEGFGVDSPMPETRALMAALDEVRPTVMASLHNGDFGGAYFYVNRGGDPLYAALAELCAAEGIPLHLGEPEFPLSTVFAPAMYSVPTATEIHALATGMGLDPAELLAGGSSLDYTRRYGDPVGVVVELPHWQDGRAADDRPHPSGRSRREVVVSELDAQEDSLATLQRLYDAASPLPPSAFADALASFLRMEAAGVSQERRQEATTDPAFDRPATVAEVFSAREDHHSYRLRMAGMLLRALPPGSPLQAEVSTVLDGWTRDTPGEPTPMAIPIRSLVAVQAGAVLATVAFARGAR